jgi:hypothetical protein
MGPNGPLQPTLGPIFEKIAYHTGSNGHVRLQKERPKSAKWSPAAAFHFQDLILREISFTDRSKTPCESQSHRSKLGAPPPSTPPMATSIYIIYIHTHTSVEWGLTGGGKTVRGIVVALDVVEKGGRGRPPPDFER